MGKGDIERETIFHIIVMLLVLFVVASIIFGVNFFLWTQQGQLSDMFEPGKLGITNKNAQGEIGHLIEFDCSGAAYTLILDKPKFYYKGDAGKTLDFIVLLDYRNVLFLGKDENDNTKTIHCTPDESGKEFQCPEDIIKFKLEGVTGVTGNQVFHFTMWNAKQSVISAAESGQTLFTMMDSYPEAYMTSIDAAVNVDLKCKETKCSAFDKTGCDNENLNNGDCYWKSPFGIDWISSCKVCPSSTVCGDYDRDACVKCITPLANCHVTLLGGCEAI